MLIYAFPDFHSRESSIVYFTSKHNLQAPRRAQAPAWPGKSSGMVRFRTHFPRSPGPREDARSRRLWLSPAPSPLNDRTLLCSIIGLLASVVNEHSFHCGPSVLTFVSSAFPCYPKVHPHCQGGSQSNDRSPSPLSRPC